MNLQPLNGNVLLEPVEAADQTSGGIYLPESAKERPTEGIVRALSADAGEEVELGDRVIYKKFAGEEISYEGKDYRLVPYGDLLIKFVSADEIPE